MAMIDTDRFLRDLNELRQIGAYKTGVFKRNFVFPEKVGEKALNS